MQHCLNMVTRRYDKGAVIYRMGETARAIGVILSGSVIIEHGDLWGNTSILDVMEPGEIFGEMYACLPHEPLMVDVIAGADTEVLFVEVARISQFCPMGCSRHGQLISNLLAISAQRNLSLSRKIFHTSSKSIRSRLLSYLSHEATRASSRTVTIPFDRRQLADYLGVDRSALSHEISKMKREGLLEARKNQFRILQDEAMRVN